jgi:hypothetical protein
MYPYAVADVKYLADFPACFLRGHYSSIRTYELERLPDALLIELDAL